MESQGINPASYLSDLPQVAAENGVLSSSYNSTYSENKPAFLELLSLLKTQFQDQNQPNTELGLTLSVTHHEITNPLPEDRALNFIPVESYYQPLLLPQSPVRQAFLGGKPQELNAEAISIQVNGSQYTKPLEKSELSDSNIQNNLKSIPLTEIKIHETPIKPTASAHPESLKPAGTETAEPNHIPESSLKIKYTDLPASELFVDKPGAQNHTVAQTAASKIMQLTKVNEKSVVPSGVHSAIPVMAGSAESSPNVEPPKSFVSETVLPAVRSSSIMQPEIPLNRIGQTLIQMISRGEQTLELRLDPPELGKLTLTVAMERDSVTVQMHTGNQAVRDLLLMQVDRLRATLADESMTLGQLSVNISDQNTQERKQALTSETLFLADGGSESGEYQAASVIFKAQGGRLLDHFV